MDVSSYYGFEKTKERPLHEQVREHLRQLCLKESPDIALPPLRQLSELMGVNHITISRALRELEAENVLRIIPGKGTFVAKVEREERAVEMLTFYSDRQDLMDTSRHTFSGMQNGLNIGTTLTGSTVIVPPVPKADTFIQNLKMRQIDAIAIFGFGYLPYPDSFLETQFIYELAEQVPVVLVGKEHPLLKLDCIYCDPAPQMQAFLEECYGGGMRRFDYLGAGDNQPHLKHRLDAFQEFLLSHGLQWQRPSQPAGRLENSTIQQVLDTHPEMVVVPTPDRAVRLILEAQQRGLQPGRDLQILCFAGSIEEVQAIAPYVNVVLLEEEEVGRCVIHRIHCRLNGEDKPAPLSRRVPGKLVRQGKLRH